MPAIAEEIEPDCARIVARIFWVKRECVIDSKEMRKALRTIMRGIATRQEPTMLAVMARSISLTQEQAGKLLNCTRSRIRQWEDKGYRLLRARSGVLMPFVEE